MNDLERRVAAGFTELDPTGAGGGDVTVQPYTCEKKNGVYAQMFHKQASYYQEISVTEVTE